MLIRKKLTEVNLKNSQLEKQLRVLKQAGLNNKKELQVYKINMKNKKNKIK